MSITNDLREEVARIIEPDAWKMAGEAGFPGWAVYALTLQASLAKAGAILSLPALALRGEGEEGGSAGAESARTGTLPVLNETQRSAGGLSAENAALIERQEARLGISPQLADELRERWGQANLLLDAARTEGDRAQAADGGAETGLTYQEAMQESAYLAGMKTGWNFGIGEDKEGYLRAVEARAGYLKPIAAAKRARAASSHASDCAVHNEPALPAGPCDCGAGQ